MSIDLEMCVCLVLQGHLQRSLGLWETSLFQQLTQLQLITFEFMSLCISFPIKYKCST